MVGTTRGSQKSISQSLQTRYRPKQIEVTPQWFPFYPTEKKIGSVSFTPHYGWYTQSLGSISLGTGRGTLRLYPSWEPDVDVMIVRINENRVVRHRLPSYSGRGRWRD